MTRAEIFPTPATAIEFQDFSPPEVDRAGDLGVLATDPVSSYDVRRAILLSRRHPCKAQGTPGGVQTRVQRRRRGVGLWVDPSNFDVC